MDQLADYYPMATDRRVLSIELASWTPYLTAIRPRKEDLSPWSNEDEDEDDQHHQGQNQSWNLQLWFLSLGTFWNDCSLRWFWLEKPFWLASSLREDQLSLRYFLYLWVWKASLPFPSPLLVFFPLPIPPISLLFSLILLLSILSFLRWLEENQWLLLFCKQGRLAQLL